MKINELFAKPIDRPIEGVIKADDEAHLANELFSALSKFKENIPSFSNEGLEMRIQRLSESLTES